VFRTEVASALQSDLESALESAVCVGWSEEYMCLCLSSPSVDSLRYHLCKEGIRACGFDEALAGVLLLQPSSLYAQRTQHPASSLLGPWEVVA
jgi:hypothetical protein